MCKNAKLPKLITASGFNFGGWITGRIVSLQPDTDIQKPLSNGSREPDTDIRNAFIDISRIQTFLEKVVHCTIIHIAQGCPTCRPRLF